MTNQDDPVCAGANSIFSPINSKHFITLNAKIRVQHFSHVKVVFNDKYFGLGVCHAASFRLGNRFFLYDEFTDTVSNGNALGFVDTEFIAAGNPL
jgi:hypothetical protein